MYLARRCEFACRVAIDDFLDHRVNRFDDAADVTFRVERDLDEKVRNWNERIAVVRASAVFMDMERGVELFGKKCSNGKPVIRWNVERTGRCDPRNNAGQSACHRSWGYRFREKNVAPAPALRCSSLLSTIHAPLCDGNSPTWYVAVRESVEIVNGVFGAADHEPLWSIATRW